MTLLELFQPSLAGKSSTVGLEFGGLEHTFGDLEQAGARTAGWLSAQGLTTGDRIAVYLPNCVELIHLYLASAKLGLIFTPMNVLYREREIEHILSDAEPKLLFATAELEPANTAGVKTILVEDLAQLTSGVEAAPAAQIDDNSIAALVYTSGTTGRPKGAMLTHENFSANARNINECWRMTADDRLLLSLPLFHVHGLGNGLHTWLSLGYRTRLLERFRKETILDEFLSFEPSVFFGVPTMYERLLETPPELAQKIGGFMRLFVSGSAPLPAATMERFRELFGHVILERYGMSETLMNLSNPYDAERRPGSVGFPMPNVSIRLVNAETGSQVKQGETGEVLLKGPNVFRGYWRRDEATAEAFTEDGFFHSGDLATCSADGYYTLQGRSKELIISSGFNIYPREIEEFLTEQPGVAEAAIVGESDPLKGEVPVGYVVMDEGCELDQQGLQEACRSALASFKVPRRFCEVDVLPRNALGKVQKHLLSAPTRNSEHPA